MNFDFVKKGIYIQARDNNNWYSAKIIDVKYEPLKILIHFKGWSNKFDEWVTLTPETDKIRAAEGSNLPKEFAVNDLVLARWSQKFEYAPARIVFMDTDEKGYSEVTFADKTRRRIKSNTIRHLDSKYDLKGYIASLKLNLPILDEMCHAKILPLENSPNLPELPFTDLIMIIELKHLILKWNMPEGQILKIPNVDDQNNNYAPSLIKQEFIDETKSLLQASSIAQIKLDVKHETLVTPFQSLVSVEPQQGKLNNITASNPKRKYVRKKPFVPKVLNRTVGKSSLIDLPHTWLPIFTQPDAFLNGDDHDTDNDIKIEIKIPQPNNKPDLLPLVHVENESNLSSRIDNIDTNEFIVTNMDLYQDRLKLIYPENDWFEHSYLIGKPYQDELMPLGTLKSCFRKHQPKRMPEKICASKVIQPIKSHDKGHKSPPRRYQCNQKGCTKVFRNTYLLESHLRHFHGLEEIPSDFCGKNKSHLRLYGSPDGRASNDEGGDRISYLSSSSSSYDGDQAMDPEVKLLRRMRERKKHKFARIDNQFFNRGRRRKPFYSYSPIKASPDGPQSSNVLQNIEKDNETDYTPSLTPLEFNKNAALDVTASPPSPLQSSSNVTAGKIKRRGKLVFNSKAFFMQSSARKKLVTTVTPINEEVMETLTHGDGDVSLLDLLPPEPVFFGTHIPNIPPMQRQISIEDDIFDEVIRKSMTGVYESPPKGEKRSFGATLSPNIKHGPSWTGIKRRRVGKRKSVDLLAFQSPSKVGDAKSDDIQITILSPATKKDMHSPTKNDDKIDELPIDGITTWVKRENDQSTAACDTVLPTSLGSVRSQSSSPTKCARGSPKKSRKPKPALVDGSATKTSSRKASIKKIPVDVTILKIIHCTCGFNQNTESLLLQCGICFLWQHSLCLNNDEEQQLSPANYICWFCLHPPNSNGRLKDFINMVKMKGGSKLAKITPKSISQDPNHEALQPLANHERVFLEAVHLERCTLAIGVGVRNLRLRLEHLEDDNCLGKREFTDYESQGATRDHYDSVPHNTNVSIFNGTRDVDPDHPIQKILENLLAPLTTENNGYALTKALDTTSLAPNVPINGEWQTKPILKTGFISRDTGPSVFQSVDNLKINNEKYKENDDLNFNLLLLQEAASSLSTTNPEGHSLIMPPKEAQRFVKTDLIDSNKNLLETNNFSANSISDTSKNNSSAIPENKWDSLKLDEMRMEQELDRIEAKLFELENNPYFLFDTTQLTTLPPYHLNNSYSFDDRAHYSNPFARSNHYYTGISNQNNYANNSNIRNISSVLNGGVDLYGTSKALNNLQAQIKKEISTIGEI